MKINQLFGVKSQPTRPAASTTPPPPPPESEGSLPGDDGSVVAVRQQLVQVLVRDTARRAGIPAQWLDCQMLLTASRSQGAGMYVRLIMKHWDLRLLTYAAAFQKALLADIMRFEPRANEWLLGISWQLDGGDSCPHKDLPDPAIWAQAPGPARH